MSKPWLPQTAAGVLRPHPGVLRPEGSKTAPGFWDHRQRLCTVETLCLFLSSASGEGEYGILEPKFPDGGHCQSVLRRQWVLLLPQEMMVF